MTRASADSDRMTLHADAVPLLGVRVWAVLRTATDVFRSLASTTSTGAAWPTGDALDGLSYRRAPLSDQLERLVLLQTIGNI